MLSEPSTCTVRPVQEDPAELHNLIDRPELAGIIAALKDELHRLQAEVGDERYPLDRD